MGGVINQHDLLSGVKLHPLKVMQDERGFVKHMLRADAPYFNGFGEVYFSYTHQYVVKGWKRHLRIAQNMAVPQGNMLIVLYDPRPDSPTCGKLVEVLLGDDHYALLQIPPGLIYGFMPLSAPGALIVNCIDQPYQPDEAITYPLNSADIPYQWSERDALV